MTGMPASSSSCGPRFGYRPVMLIEALTTAATFRLISSSALTRSRSEWSMTAISPGLSRLVMFFVLRSTRATATMPGGSPALPRNTGGITDGSFIESHPARARSAPTATLALTACH